MTAPYLHNRLPFSPLGGAIPLTPLFPNASLFRLPTRVFGCTAFVQDYTPSLYKLAPRALKGVFVGYSCTQKGYRVYFPDTRRYITSTDVTFHEDVPYFSSSTTPLKAPISPPGFPSVPPSSLSPSQGISTTPSTLPLTLLTSDDCLTQTSLVIPTPPSSSCLPFTDRSTPLVPSTMTLDSTVSSPAPTTTPHDPPLDDLIYPLPCKRVLVLVPNTLLTLFLMSVFIQLTAHLLLSFPLSHYPIRIMKLSKYLSGKQPWI